MRALAAIGALALASYAHATDYPTIDAAIAIACAESLARSDAGTVEYAMAIVQTSAGFKTTAPVRGDADSFRLAVRLGRGERLAALFHTHPGTEATSELVSADDVWQADSLGLPSYVLVTHSRHLKRYVPHHTALRHLDGMRMTPPVSDGERVDISALASAS